MKTIEQIIPALVERTQFQAQIIEQIQAKGKPTGELRNVLAQLSSNGKPSPLFQSNRAMLLDRKIQSPRTHPQPHKRDHPFPIPPIEVWRKIGAASPGDYSAYSPEEAPVLGVLNTVSGPMNVSSVQVHPDSGDFSMAVATGLGPVTIFTEYSPLENIPSNNPWVGTGISASMIQIFVLPAGENFDLIEASVTLSAPHMAESVGSCSESLKAGSKDSKGREKVSGGAIIGGMTVNTWLGLMKPQVPTASGYSLFLDKTSQSGSQVVNYSPLENNGTIAVSVTSPFDGSSQFFAVEVVLDIDALIMGEYPGVSADNEAAWCDLRFADNDLMVWDDGIYDVPPEEYADYSCPLTVTGIEVWGGRKL